MKLLTLVLVICSFAVVAPQATGQETRLHLTRFFPDSSPGRVVLSALSAQRDVSVERRDHSSSERKCRSESYYVRTRSGSFRRLQCRFGRYACGRGGLQREDG